LLLDAKHPHLLQLAPVSPLIRKLPALDFSFGVLLGLLSFHNALLQAAPKPIQMRLSQLPLAFEANAGQFEPDSMFAARSAAATISLNKAGAILYLHDAQRRPVRLTMAPVGATRSITLEGLNEAEGKANYFLGNDSSKWLTDCETVFASALPERLPRNRHDISREPEQPRVRLCCLPWR
jgi:hypothetical protein